MQQPSPANEEHLQLIQHQYHHMIMHNNEFQTHQPNKGTKSISQPCEDVDVPSEEDDDDPYAESMMMQID